MQKELNDYIQQARESGMSDEAMRKELHKAGWGSADIEDALRSKPKIALPKPAVMGIGSVAVVLIAIAGYLFFGMSGALENDVEVVPENESAIDSSGESKMQPEGTLSCQTDSDCTYYRADNCCGLKPINTASYNAADNQAQVCLEICEEVVPRCENNTCVLDSVGINTSQGPALKEFSDSSTGLSFMYPLNWELSSQEFSQQNNFVASVSITGPTQTEFTELHDGARFSIMQPVQTQQTLREWVESNYTVNVNDDPYVISEQTVGSRTYVTAYGCGLGCFTYYFTKVDTTIYGFVAIAEGGDKETYEDQILTMLASVKFSQ